MNKMVETPAGRGRLTAAAELAGDWRIGVALEEGKTWIGSVKELVGEKDAATFERFKENLEKEGVCQ